jgi:hypothetical protein
MKDKENTKLILFESIFLIKIFEEWWLGNFDNNTLLN